MTRLKISMLSLVLIVLTINCYGQKRKKDTTNWLSYELPKNWKVIHNSFGSGTRIAPPKPTNNFFMTITCMHQANSLNDRFLASIRMDHVSEDVEVEFKDTSTLVVNSLEIKEYSAVYKDARAETILHGRLFDSEHFSYLINIVATPKYFEKSKDQILEILNSVSLLKGSPDNLEARKQLKKIEYENFQKELRSKEVTTDETLEPAGQDPNLREERAMYPGGQQGLLNYLMTNIEYPESAQKEGIQGRVYVQFVVEKDGSTSNYEVLSSPDPALSEEAIRVLKSDPAIWEPGKSNGEPVRTYFKVPVIFRLK